MKFSQKSLPYRVHQFIEHHELFERADHLLLACSGGLDSVVLSHLLKQLDYRVTLAHMNFQLRGADSDGDAAFVEELARSRVQGFVSKTVDTKAEAEKGESTQMVARRLRYAWFNELLREGDYKTLLTAHHADDDLETALINLIRSTGIEGLTGMRPKKYDRVRPLLDVTKDELLSYANKHNLKWREDSSNDSDDYLRNRIRHQLIPLLNEFGLDGKRWRRTAANLSDDAVMREIGIDYIEENYIDYTGEGSQVTLTDIYGTPIRGQSLLVRHEGARYDFTPEQCEQLLKANPGTVLTSITGAQAIKRADEIEFAHQLDEADLPTPVAIEQLPVEVAYTSGYLATLELVPRPKNLNEPGVLYLAPPPLPLHLRPRRKGDKLQPLGMKGRNKKLQDYFVDKKYFRLDRDFVPLLTNQDDEILAVIPLGISELARVSPDMTEVLRVSWGPYWSS